MEDKVRIKNLKSFLAFFEKFGRAMIGKKKFSSGKADKMRKNVLVEISYFGHYKSKFRKSLLKK